MKVMAGGVVHTLAEGGEGADAVAWEAGRIVAVGPRAEVIARAGAGAEVVELGGRAVVPGFVDAHHHLAIAVVLGGAMPCGPSVAPTVSALVERMRAAAVGLPEGEWLVGFGW